MPILRDVLMKKYVHQHRQVTWAAFEQAGDFPVRNRILGTRGSRTCIKSTEGVPVRLQRLAWFRLSLPTKLSGMTWTRRFLIRKILCSRQCLTKQRASTKVPVAPSTPLIPVDNCVRHPAPLSLMQAENWTWLYEQSTKARCTSTTSGSGYTSCAAPYRREARLWTFYCRTALLQKINKLDSFKNALMVKPFLSSAIIKVILSYVFFKWNGILYLLSLMYFRNVRVSGIFVTQAYGS